MSDLIDDQKLIHTEIHTEMRKSYIDYAMSVIVGRALPDVRDGLKPVHRRILYGLSELGLTPDKAFKKSARIVGDVMGKYHPHGDSSVYDAMVRLAQDFSVRYLLVDGHGNFGSVDGDSAAAMRYTEARMAPLSLQMLRDIDKDTVDFIPNFDGDEKEPVVLPARFPNLLVNGSNGIAVGMATSIPPHNLGEVIDACIYLIDNKEGTVEDLIKIVKGPDFPTGATILGKKGVKEGYRTGRGKVVIRSKTEIEPLKNGKMQIVVTEIPYQVNKAVLQEKIELLVKNKVIEGITGLRDETNRKGMRIVIELKKDANAHLILNRLYKNTALQSSFSLNFVALVDGAPKRLNLYDMLSEYLKHQKDVLTRRSVFEIKKAKARLHILEGYRIALDNIDEVIKTIRAAYNDAKQKLMDKFGLSDIQAQAILDMRLARLQGLEREKIEEEYKALVEKIKFLQGLLDDEEKLMQVVKEELTEIKEKYSDKRRTTFENSAEEIDEEELIEEKNVVITLTNLGYVKRVDSDTYKSQKRGGKGVTGLKTREEDFVKYLFTTSTHDYLMFFTNKGRVYKIKAYDIPEAGRTAKGTPIVNFLELMSREFIAAVLPVKEFPEDKYLIAATKFGTIKKTALSNFESNRTKGVIAIKLAEDDELIGVKESSGNDAILIVTKNGKANSFWETDVRPMGRTAAGVRGINLKDNDEVISMELANNKENMLLVISENGYGKRTPVTEYTIHKRGGTGMSTYDKTKFEKTGKLVSAMIVSEGDELFLINSEGIIIKINADDVSRSSRSTMGVRIMRVEEGSKIVSIAKVLKEEEKEDDLLKQ